MVRHSLRPCVSNWEIEKSRTQELQEFRSSRMEQPISRLRMVHALPASCNSCLLSPVARSISLCFSEVSLKWRKLSVISITKFLRHDDGSLWELGRGAMGITYKAFDTNLRCPVALKVINNAYLNSDVARQRFLREARAAAALRHQNVASVFHLGTDHESYFYAMEFVDGETVDAYMKRTGPLTPGRSVGYHASGFSSTCRGRKAAVGPPGS